MTHKLLCAAAVAAMAVVAVAPGEAAGRVTHAKAHAKTNGTDPVPCDPHSPAASSHTQNAAPAPSSTPGQPRCLLERARTHAHRYARTRTHAHARTHTHTHTHTHAHAHTHTHVHTAPAQGHADTPARVPSLSTNQQTRRPDSPAGRT